ncbi:MAG: glycosyl transferase group 1 [Phycisphaerales bacterium]|nr:glycosyl transferase group 1 [Phycisphaerales bacterium]
MTRAVLDFCAIFASLGHTTTLVTSDATDVPTEWLGGAAGTPKVVVIDPPRGRLELLPRAAVARLDDLLRETDVLHLHAPWTASNTQFAAAARHLGVPYVLTLHGMLDDWSMAQKRLKKRIYLAIAGNRLLRGAAAIHCTAQAELEQASHWFSRERGVVLPLLFDLEAFRRLPGPALARARFPQLNGDRPALLFLSRVHPKKGLEQLIGAAGELRRRGTECEILIAGPGNEEYAARLQALATSLGVRDIVHFMGMVRGEEKLSLYQATDLFVLPTSQENFGLVLLESLACGTPVLTTSGVDIWQELQAAGARIADAAPEALATAIGELLSDRTGLKSRGDAGRRWVFERYEPRRLAGEYEALYRSVSVSGASEKSSE